MPNLLPWAWHPQTPGVTIRWLARANDVSVWTIRRWRRRYAQPPAALDLSLELGLAMALARPPRGLMPLWSRMALAEYAHNGVSDQELAKMFRCSKNTVWRCVRQRSTAFERMSGRRLLSSQQQLVAQSCTVKVD